MGTSVDPGTRAILVHNGDFIGLIAPFKCATG